MRLILYRKNLRPEFRSIHLPLVAFNHFPFRIQSAIVSTIQGGGLAQFLDYDGITYVTIHLPPDDDDTAVVGDNNVILKGSNNRFNISR